MLTATAECPFSVGDEVTITQGHGGRPLEIRRVVNAYWYASRTGCYKPGYRVHLEGMTRPFHADDLGWVRHLRYDRKYIVPTTDEHRGLLRRTGLVGMAERCRWAMLPTPALEEVAKILLAYRGQDL